MITDQDTNFVYFSKLLFEKGFDDEFHRISTILEEHDINYGLLEGTADIWCRDYMPIQISKDTFVQYNYDPDYLKPLEFQNLKTNPDIPFHDIGCISSKVDLVLDGGNVTKFKNSLILTDKILIENKNRYDKERIVEELKDAFDVEKIILIPWDIKHDIFGHADGMIRFIDDKTVLINGYFKYYPIKFRDQFFGALQDNNLNYLELNYEVPKPTYKWNWGYINYLQMKDILLIPQFGIDEDAMAVQQLKEVFQAYDRGKKIETVSIRRILEGGGGLNCLSWNIFT